MDNWIQRRVEESYFGQLERMLVRRLQNRHSEPGPPKSNVAEKCVNGSLNKLSIEMSEELDRLENLIAVERSK